MPKGSWSRSNSDFVRILKQRLLTIRRAHGLTDPEDYQVERVMQPDDLFDYAQHLVDSISLTAVERQQLVTLLDAVRTPSDEVTD